MRFEERRVGDAAVLTPEGGIDATEVTAFAARIDALVAAGVRTVVCDLSGLEVLPSTAAGILLQAAQRLRAVGGRLLLAGPNRRARTTLETMGVLPLFPVFPDVESALPSPP
jgi:anti-anti-sigma factor